MNFRFKLSRRLARIKCAAVITGALVVGCELSSAPSISRIDNIQITPNRLSLVPTQTADLTLIVTTSRGGSVDLGSLQWSTTGGTIASLGIVNGNPIIRYAAPSAAGNYVIIVTTVTQTPTATANIGVTINPVPVNAVSVSPGSASLALGDTTTLHVSLTDATGSVILGRAIDWTSSDQGVATVLATGLVRAIAPGSTTITATCEGHSGTAVVTVTP